VSSVTAGRGREARRGKAPTAIPLALAAALGLAGCVESSADLTASREGSYQFVRRPDAAMAGATLAIMSVEGGPEGLGAQFEQSLESAAAQRQIALAAPTSAKYLARGYLSASPVRDGAAIDFVWDVFTPDKQRAQRLADTLIVRGAAEDPWALVTPAALDSIAARSADELAAYLSNTPEAAAGGALSYAQ
jgi:hypothetical protein